MPTWHPSLPPSCAAAWGAGLQLEAGQPRQLGQLREVVLTDGWGHRLEGHLQEDLEPVEVQQEVQQRQAAKEAVGGLRLGSCCRAPCLAGLGAPPSGTAAAAAAAAGQAGG
jgi:hypothetical protein